MKVYLGGPINGCSDEEAHGWRDEVKKVLSEAGHTWADPMDRDYRGRELEPGIADAIVNGDIEDIISCDLLLMNAPKPSYGTAMEIMYGAHISKPVVVVLPEGAVPSPWVVYHSTDIRYGSVIKTAQWLVSEGVK